MVSKECLDHKMFYDNIKLFHSNTVSILRLINDYASSNNNKNFDHKFAAILIENNEVAESYHIENKGDLSNIEFWISDADRKEYIENIYRADLQDDVFLFKIFPEAEDCNENFVMAGYVIKNSVSLRSFLTSLNEQIMRQKYEKILSIL